MTTNTITCHDLYLRHTGADGSRDCRQHRVWDSELFVTARAGELAKQNAEDREKGGKGLAAVEVIDQATFLRERAPRG